MSKENSAWANGVAAQAWCTPGTSSVTMDPKLALAFASILDREMDKQGRNFQSELRGAIAELLQVISYAEEHPEESIKLSDTWPFIVAYALVYK